jgi:serine/threonine protein kinase
VPTDTGVVVGTPRFVSPEGALGKRVDARADVYAAGLILYLLLVGKGPFDHLRSDAQILSAHVNLEPAAPSAAAGVPPNQAWPKVLDEVVLRALSKNPAARFQNAKELGEALHRVWAAIDAHLPPRVEGSCSAVDAEVERLLPAARPLSSEAIGSEPGGTASEMVEIPVSLPRVRQLLMFSAVVAATAVAVSQLARLALSVWL